MSTQCRNGVVASPPGVGVTRVPTIELVGGELPLAASDTLITRGGVTLRVSRGRSTWETWHRPAGLVVSDKVAPEPFLPHCLPLSALPEGPSLVRREAGKVLLVPSLPDEPLVFG